MTAKPSLAAQLIAVGGAVLSVAPLVIGWGSSLGMLVGGFTGYAGPAGLLVVLLAIWAFIVGPGGTLLFFLGWSAWRRGRFRLGTALFWSPLILFAVPIVAIGVITRAHPS